MEAASVPQPQAPPGKRFTEFVGAQILWILLGGVLLLLLIQDPVRTLNNVVDGLSVGTIWALIALGYTLVYGIIELINFAHGDVFMLGSMLALTIFLAIGLTHQTPFIMAVAMILGVLVFVMGATALLNVSIERFAYRPLRNAPKVAPLISAIGVSFVSMLKRTRLSPIAFTRSNNAASVGMRVPSAGCCSGRLRAYAVSGFRRPTS